MVKVRVIHRNPEDYVRTKPGDLQKIFRNPDPHLHPFEREREYIRALNAVKLQKMFAKPLLFAMEGHRDGVKCMTRGKAQVAALWTGSCNGEIGEWNLASRKKVSKVFQAHDGFIRGLCVSPKDKHLLSGGDDRKIKMWPLFSPSSSLSTLDVTQLQLKTSIALSSAMEGEEEEDEDEDGQEQTMPALIDQT
ncbi:sof1 family domain-containing protein, partial [Cystoisospora suis]